jgi:hypothetical protein
MKKILCSLALLFALTACTMNDMIALLVTPTIPPPPPAVEQTLDPSAFTTPTQPPTSTQIPTFTFTPTLIGAGGSLDGTADGTANGTQALPTLVLVPTATPGPQIILFSEPGALILSISVSSDTLFWGYCDAPKYVDFKVGLANNLRVAYVLLFMRLVDKGLNQSTGWGVGAIMKKTRDGYYTYRITREHLLHYEEFKEAWIEYQVVASTGGLKILDSSPVYEQSLSLQKCLTIEVDE